MTKEELKKKMDMLAVKNSVEKTICIKQYIDDNNPVEIGDTVTDRVTTLIVNKICHSLWGDDPCAIYYGVELRKDGKPRKAQKSVVFQSNMIKHEKK